MNLIATFRECKALNDFSIENTIKHGLDYWGEGYFFIANNEQEGDSIMKFLLNNKLKKGFVVSSENYKQCDHCEAIVTNEYSTELESEVVCDMCHTILKMNNSEWIEGSNGEVYRYICPSSKVAQTIKSVTTNTVNKGFGFAEHHYNFTQRLGSIGQMDKETVQRFLKAKGLEKMTHAECIREFNMPIDIYVLMNINEDDYEGNNKLYIEGNCLKKEVVGEIERSKAIKEIMSYSILPNAK